MEFPARLLSLKLFLQTVYYGKIGGRIASRKGNARTGEDLTSAARNPLGLFQQLEAP